MRHTKKMIMVPEEEYIILLSMLKGADTLSYEKANLEQEMSKALRQPTTNEGLKSKRYDWLYKQKRGVDQQLANRPQKVFVENMPILKAPSVAPYLETGNAAKNNLTPLSDNSRDDITVGRKKQSFTKPSVTEKNLVEEVTAKRGKRLSSTATISSEYGDAQPYIREEYIPELMKFVEENKSKLNISEDGKIKVSNNRYIGDYKNAVSAFAKKNRDPEDAKGFNTLFNQLKNEPFYIELYNKSLQKGFGKIVPIKKTKGLVRERKFRPKIWARL